MNSRVLVLSVAMVGAAVFASSTQAQRRAAFSSRPASRPRTAVLREGRVGTSFAPSRRMRRIYAGSGFAPYFYADYDSEPGTIDAPGNQIVEQAPPPKTAEPVPKPPESLVLELQGDHWVRITNYGQSQTGGQSGRPDREGASDLPFVVPPVATRQIQEVQPASELPPAVLVFRDGHREPIGKYLIMGPAIYTSADYWSSGRWTRKVEIAELDVPATMKLNQERGANFSLPSRPSEVMIRP
jgi:hypothetical protein